MTPRTRGRPPVPASVAAATRGRIAALPRSLSGRGAAASAAVARAAVGHAAVGHAAVGHAAVGHAAVGHAAARSLDPALGGAAMAAIEASGAGTGGA